MKEFIGVRKIKLKENGKKTSSDQSKIFYDRKQTVKVKVRTDRLDQTAFHLIIDSRGKTPAALKATTTTA